MWILLKFKWIALIIFSTNKLKKKNMGEVAKIEFGKIENKQIKLKWINLNLTGNCFI
jgi:hypothetical protein